MGELKAAAFGRLAGIDRQVAHFRVIAAQPGLPGIDQRDRQRVLEVGLDRPGRGGCAASAQLPGQRLGRAIQAVDIVVFEVEPVAHFLPRQAGDRSGFGRKRLVHHGQPLAGPAIGLVQGNEPLGQQGLLLGKAGQLRGVHRLGKQRVGIGLAQRGEPGFGISGADLAPVERKGAAEALDQRGGQRAVVVLQLREIGRADRQQFPHGGLVQTPLRAQRL